MHHLSLEAAPHRWTERGSAKIPHRFLLINPVVHDFSAFDFWAKPLSLYAIASWLQEAGASVILLDLMDMLHPALGRLSIHAPKRKPHGTGRFLRAPISRPSCLPFIGRKFCRYGFPPAATMALLKGMQKPHAVFMTSMMTYWYPGVQETIRLVKSCWPDVPIVLGGVYASLCPAHAKQTSGADLVISGAFETALSELSDWMGDAMPSPMLEIEPRSSRLPAYSLSPWMDSAAIRTSIGCPFACSYCGVHALHPRFQDMPVSWVMQVFEHLTMDLGIQNIAIYDDAFLCHPHRAADILERITHLGRPLQLHAASGMGCRGITSEMALLMKKAGVVTLRLGLETADLEAQQRLGAKVTNRDFEEALDHLTAAGYERKHLGAYVLVGLPGQTRHEVELSVDYVLACGVTPHLAEYSPVPGSPLFAEARRASSWDLDEPLFHNPTILPCANADLTAEALVEIKLRIQNASR